MKYMLLIVSGDPNGPQATEADTPSIIEQFYRLTTDLQAAGKLVHSSRLRPRSEAKFVRVGRTGGGTLLDGPFTETKEAVGGYYMLDCQSEAEAIEWAKKFPSFSRVEVRQIWEM